MPLPATLWVLFLHTCTKWKCRRRSSGCSWKCVLLTLWSKVWSRSAARTFQENLQKSTSGRRWCLWSRKDTNNWGRRTRIILTQMHSLFQADRWSGASLTWAVVPESQHLLAPIMPHLLVNIPSVSWHRTLFVQTFFLCLCACQQRHTEGEALKLGAKNSLLLTIKTTWRFQTPFATRINKTPIFKICSKCKDSEQNY